MSKAKISKKTKAKKEKNNVIYFFILIAVIMGAFLITLLVVQATSNKKEKNLLEDTFTLPTPESLEPGKDISVDEKIVGDYQIDKHSEKDDFLGKPSLIYFAGTYCGSCLQTIPVVKEVIWDEYNLLTNIWVQVINNDTFNVEINQGTNSNIDMSDFMPSCNYIPSFVVLDKEGNITLESCGSEKTPNDIKQELDRLLELN
jgi:thiol-disulfide isomerase/thioredoxin